MISLMTSAAFDLTGNSGPFLPYSNVSTQFVWAIYFFTLSGAGWHTAIATHTFLICWSPVAYTRYFVKGKALRISALCVFGVTIVLCTGLYVSNGVRAINQSATTFGIWGDVSNAAIGIALSWSIAVTVYTAYKLRLRLMSVEERREIHAVVALTGFVVVYYTPPILYFSVYLPFRCTSDVMVRSSLSLTEAALFSCYGITNLIVFKRFFTRRANDEKATQVLSESTTSTQKSLISTSQSLSPSFRESDWLASITTEETRATSNASTSSDYVEGYRESSGASTSSEYTDRSRTAGTSSSSM
jgi:hypothetical protein